MSGIYIIKHQFLLVVESNSQFIKIEYCNKKIPGISEETNEQLVSQEAICRGIL